MLKPILRLLLSAVFLLAGQACAPSNVPTSDPNFISTLIAQTLAALTLTPDIPVTGEESSTPSVTATTTPTLTMTTAPSATIAAPAPTSTALVLVSATAGSTSTGAVTPGAIQVQVSVATNCRTGPGVEYERVGVLQAGDLAEVVGRNASGEYWIIRNPARTSQTCWLWGQYANLLGDTSGLPVLTPPSVPTSAAGFDVFYDGLERCTTTGWWLDINVENLGGLAFRSIAMTIEDRDTDSELSLEEDGFTNRNGCSETEIRTSLPAGVDRTVSSPVFNYDPTGHRLRVTITLCSDPNQRGTCITQTVNFNP